MPLFRAHRRLVALVLAVPVLVGACSSGDGGGAPSPGSLVVGDVTGSAAALASLDPADTRSVSLAPVRGRDAAVPVQIRGGDAGIGGTVRLQGEPVPGVTVRLERHADDGVAALEVSSDGEGRFAATGLLGGRYVVRAWRAPDLTLVAAEALFLSGGTQGSLDLRLVRLAPVADWSVELVDGPDRVVVGEEATVVLRVTRVTGSDPTPVEDDPSPPPADPSDQASDPSDADAAGEGDASAMTSPRLLVLGSPGWSVAPDEVLVVDGRAELTAMCLEPGAATLVLALDGARVEIRLPLCHEGGSTGHADLAAEPDVAVGATFTVPFDGPVPAGTYESDDEHFCEVAFERLLDGEWEEVPQVIARGWTFNTSTTVRDLRAAPGSEPCTYERTA